LRLQAASGTVVLNTMGNGAAIKAGARVAWWSVFMDADGQHRPEDIPNCWLGLLRASTWLSGRAEKLSSECSPWNWQQIYNRLAS
jgi:hypothetical protein